MAKRLFFTIVVLFGFAAPRGSARAQTSLQDHQIRHDHQARTNFHGLVVLIDFPDAPGTTPLARVDSIINGIGYTEPTVTHSLRDYWYAQSRGQIAITHDVFGYYRAPQTAAWYNNAQGFTFQSLVADALNWVVATNPGYDWNALSLASGPMNRNGTEEGTFLSVAFLTTAWIPGTGGTHWLLGWTAPNGVGTQQIVGATLKSPWDANVNLFWLTHEQGHAIWGWPDTYDTTDHSRGTGIYCVMSGNEYTGDVEPVGAPFLLAEHWVRAETIKNGNVVLEPDGDAVARHVNPAEPREYFLIEARTNATIGNAAFPVPRGLLIWHVDERVTTGNTLPQMTSAQHYMISVEQADGRFDMERNVNAGEAADIFVPGSVFNEFGTPDSNWWDASPSHLSIDRIDFKNERISFRATVK
jgi:M6 family metalloprotease-like protein